MPKFKDIKRRGVETFLQAVGASGETQQNRPWGSN